MQANRATQTADTYRRILAGYLEHLQANDQLPPGLSTGMARPQRTVRLPLSKRSAPDTLPWLHANLYLALIAEKSENTSQTYLIGLRLLADWVHVHRRDGYENQVWPLDPAVLTTETIIEYDRWLIANRARRTRLTYLAALMGYLNDLEASRALPAGIRLEELRARFRKSVHRKANDSSRIVALDRARQDIPRIVEYFDGSSNLSRRGLLTNYELALLVEGSTATSIASVLDRLLVSKQVARIQR